MASVVSGPARRRKARRVQTELAGVGGFETHHSDFGLQCDAGRVRDASTNLGHQSGDVCGGSSGIGHDEIGVNARYLGAADTEAPQAGLVDPCASGVLWRIHEHRACVLATRLMFVSPSNNFCDPFQGGSGVIRSPLQASPRDDLCPAHAAVAISQVQCLRVLGDGLRRRGIARKIDDRRIDEARSNIAAVPAGVHPDGAADGSRHADCPFETTHSRCSASSS